MTPTKPVPNVLGVNVLSTCDHDTVILMVTKDGEVAGTVDNKAAVVESGDYAPGAVVEEYIGKYDEPNVCVDGGKTCANTVLQVTHEVLSLRPMVIGGSVMMPATLLLGALMLSMLGCVASALKVDLLVNIDKAGILCCTLVRVALGLLVISMSVSGGMLGNGDAHCSTFDAGDETHSDVSGRGARPPCMGVIAKPTRVHLDEECGAAGAKSKVLASVQMARFPIKSPTVERNPLTNDTHIRYNDPHLSAKKCPDTCHVKCSDATDCAIDAARCDDTDHCPEGAGGHGESLSHDGMIALSVDLKCIPTIITMFKEYVSCAMASHKKVKSDHLGEVVKTGMCSVDSVHTMASNEPHCPPGGVPDENCKGVDGALRVSMLYFASCDGEGGMPLNSTKMNSLALVTIDV